MANKIHKKWQKNEKNKQINKTRKIKWHKIHKNWQKNWEESEKTGKIQ